MSTTVAVRFAAGAVGEARRQAHLAPAPTPGATHECWTTFCGMHIPVEIAEVSQGPDGMPCLPCLMRSAVGTSSPGEVENSHE